MKVYFTAPTSFNGELHETNKKIVHYILKSRVTLISGQQIVDKKLLEEDKKLPSEQIYMREHNLIEQADLVIAEASRPSLGVGTEIAYALSINKPVLVLISTQYEDRISPMIKGNPSETLYLQFYNEDNLHLKINDFIKHISSLKKRRGKLIVIDGADGSGKTTQAELLVQHLKKQHIAVKYVDFPQYYHSFHGKTVAKFLRGEFGNINQVSPYLASLAYALDRASIKGEMDDFLLKGGYIIANRYATSSMAHQAAKFQDELERKEYLKWEYELEYKIHKIPRENLVIYLYVPWKISLELTKKKTDRAYLKGQKQDIAEKDLAHRIASEKMYQYLAKKYKHWVTVNCIHNGKLRKKEDIFDEIVRIINPLPFSH